MWGSSLGAFDSVRRPLSPRADERCGLFYGLAVQSCPRRKGGVLAREGPRVRVSGSWSARRDVSGAGVEAVFEGFSGELGCGGVKAMGIVVLGGGAE